MARSLDDIEEYIKECLLCYEYYVERGCSLRDTAKEVCLSFNTVKHRLEALKGIDIEKYDIYRYVAGRRRKN